MGGSGLALAISEGAPAKYVVGTLLRPMVLLIFIQAILERRSRTTTFHFEIDNVIRFKQHLGERTEHHDAFDDYWTVKIQSRCEDLSQIIGANIKMITIKGKESISLDSGHSKLPSKVSRERRFARMVDAIDGNDEATPKAECNPNVIAQVAMLRRLSLRWGLCHDLI